MKKAVIVLPTYNERDNIATLIPAIFSVCESIKAWDISVLVVDDSSPDGTAKTVTELQKKYPKLYLLTGKKEGLGRAYTRGFAYAIDKLDAEILFEMDADLSHEPKLIPKFLQKIEEGADIVVGSRYIKGGSIPSNWGLHRKIFSIAGNIVIRSGFMDFKLHEWTNGNRALRADFVKKILPELDRYNGYVFQIAVLDMARKRHLNIMELPQHFKDRDYGISKINSIQYIVDILTYILLNSSFVKFCVVGFIGFIINAVGLEFFYHQGLNPGLASAIGAEFSIISNFLLNNFWSFSHKKIAHKTHYLPQFLRFNGISVGSILIQLVVVGIGTHVFGDDKRFIFLVASVVFFIIPYSYFMYNKFVWHHKQAAA